MLLAAWSDFICICCLEADADELTKVLAGDIADDSLALLAVDSRLAMRSFNFS